MGIYLGPFRFTKRGVRVRVGPRALRLHVGAGGTGISTGAGPFTYYQAVGKGRKRKQASPYWYGFTPDGGRCPHHHRSEAAAQECTRKMRREA